MRGTRRGGGERKRRYHKPVLRRLGRMSAVTRKSGGSTDLSVTHPTRP